MTKPEKHQPDEDQPRTDQPRTDQPRTDEPRTDQPRTDQPGKHHPGQAEPEKVHADANSEGFRILRSDPALLWLELLWRWSFGLGLLAVFFLAYTRLRQAILISDADQAIFVSGDPLAIANAGAALIAASQPLLLKLLAQICGAAAVFWIIAAVPGRGLTARLICRRLASDYVVPIAPDAPRWTAFALLTMARVLMLLILLIGYLAGVLIATQVDPGRQNLLADALIVLVSLAISAVVWSGVNWVLSLAPIFVVRDGVGPLDAVVAALAFIRRRYSYLVAIALWNSTLRGLVATAITLAGAATVIWRPQHALWPTVLLLALETLLYLLASDFLLLARFAAYSSVAMREPHLGEPPI